MKRDVDKTFPFSFRIKLYLVEAVFTAFDSSPIDCAYFNFAHFNTYFSQSNFQFVTSQSYTREDICV